MTSLSLQINSVICYLYYDAAKKEIQSDNPWGFYISYPTNYTKTEINNDIFIANRPKTEYDKEK